MPSDSTAGERCEAALTIDVEEVFQIQAFAGRFNEKDWAALPSRVEQNVQRVLEILARGDTHATFFVLGWVAERSPRLVETIAEAGHEIASHGFRHRPIYDQTPDEFHGDLRRSVEILERIAGRRPLGYRAPTFSIVPRTTWALDIIRSMGFAYDASVFPISGHDFYGFPGAPRFVYRHTNGLLEIPTSTFRFLGRNWPVAGGGYLRLYPYWLTRWALRRINEEGGPALVYLHPWELDSGQPRVRGIGLRSRFRTYVNLRTTAQKLERLLGEFRLGPVSKAFASKLGIQAMEEKHAG